MAALASCVGWALDLYDLLILLYVAPAIGKLFFPSEDPLLSLSAVFASFAVTLVMRPVGSALFGSYADRRGRKGALMLAVSAAGIVTCLLGALPTIHQIGIAAPILFLALRLVQGIFIGGVVACTGTVGVEAISERWRGLMSGLVGGGGGAIGGMLAATVYWLATTLLPEGSFETIGWRFMFFAGILSSVLGLFIAHKLEESPVWVELAAARKARKQKSVLETSPLKMLFSAKYKSLFLTNLPLIAAAGAGYYLTSGYLPSYLKVALKLPDDYVSMILFVSSLSALFASLFVGQMSQWYGRRTVFLVIGGLRFVILPACALLMAQTNNLALLLLLACLFSAFGNASYAPLLAFLNERFPTSFRASGVGLSWNIGFALGGLMPTFTSLAAGTTAQLPISLACFLAGTGVIYIIGAFIIPESLGRISPLEEN